MLAAHQLVAGYPGRDICGPIDLVVEPGELVCLLGANGCGKTTLLRTLLGLLPPRLGTVTWEGHHLFGLSAQARATRLAYVPQSTRMHFPYTARDVVLMGRAAYLGPYSRPSTSDAAAADHCLTQLRITHLALQSFNQLSGGERQLVLIARALVQEALLLILDEPTSSLDFGNQVRVLKLMRSLAQAGHGVVFSTHDPEQALAIADRVLLLQGGKCLALGSSRAVVTEANLQRLYGVDVVIADIPGRHVTACVPTIN